MVMSKCYHRGPWETTPWPLICFVACYRRKVLMPDGKFVWEYSY